MLNMLAPLAVGAKDALTPLGRPDAENATVPLNPFFGAIVMALLPEAPGARVMIVGDAEIVYVPVPAIVRLNATAVVMLPDVPVTVMVDVPGAAKLGATIVRVLDPVAMAGLKDAVTPLGKPAAANETVPVKPFCA
jgi:hypothetical protein